MQITLFIGTMILNNYSIGLVIEQISIYNRIWLTKMLITAYALVT